MKSWFLRRFLRLKDVRDAIACGDNDRVYEILHGSGVDRMLTTPNRIAEVTKYLLETMSLYELLSKVTKITAWMFDCMILPKEVVIPPNITEIGAGCFSYCKGVEKLVFESGSQVERIDDWAFEACEDLKVVDLGNCHQLHKISSEALTHCTNLTDIILPQSLERIDGFDHCTNLKNIVLPSKAVGIDGGAFWSCTALESITIPDSVTVIGDNAFAGCNSLTGVTIGENSQLTTIFDYAFAYCDSLTSITMPESVTSIGEGAFYNCTSLKDVYYDGSKEQWEKIHIGEKNNSLLGAVLHFENENWVGDERCV